ncbi:DNA internalization-related competence protein ComEC/Rec2 [Vibrio sp. Vb2880]|uniref:DNA internalization-related competence protein ComEC/Rec2 n=1 Tax=Vibrio sp. Vb2880 TaxID=2816076 RepID=UPI001F5CA6C5|nr:DNA internalization-related competence protein ComEC/Rec2 [Vibrio sp. Vb2880]
MTLYSNYWMLISFSLTVLSAPYWPRMPSWDFAFICLVALMGAVLVTRLRGWGGIAFAVLVIVTHGNVMRSQSNTIFQAGQDITIKGEVDSFFKQISYGNEGSIVVRSINGQQLPTFRQPIVRLVAPIALHIGDQVTFSVTVKPIYGRLNETGFDIEAYYLSQGWVARATVKPQSAFSVVSRPSWRDTLHQKIQVATQHLQAQGMILALTFGDRNSIQEDDWRALRDSGLIHLVAISGLHIGMAFAVGYLLGSALMRIHVNALWLPWFVGLLMATVYAWLAGFTLPTQRALLMCTLNVLLTMSGWRITAVQRILLTLGALLLVSPFAPLSMSFWLSFLAVAVVLYQLASCSSTQRGWRQLVMTQCTLVLLMTPISALFFSGFSLSSALYNLVFIPWFSVVIVPLLFLGLVLTSLFEQVDWIWTLIDLSFWPLSHALTFSESSWVAVSHAITFVLCAGGIGWVLRPLLSRDARIAVALLTLGMWEFNSPKDRWRIDVLDVGHGLAVLIERQQRVLLYDTGSGWPDGSYVRSLVVPLLHQRGVHQLDGLIISHMDSDHAGGLADAQQWLSPSWILASQRQPQWRTCVAGQQWDWQGLRLQALWPPKTVSRAHNVHSCVLRLSDPEYGHSVLLAGDVTAVGEWLLSRQAKDIKSDIMIVPHHGSKTSSTARFIEHVAPQVAIASLAKGNQWHLPAQDVVQRYQATGAKWLDTGESGQITLSYRAETRLLSTLRQSGYPPWYRQMLRKGVE